MSNERTLFVALCSFLDIDPKTWSAIEETAALSITDHHVEAVSFVSRMDEYWIHVVPLSILFLFHHFAVACWLALLYAQMHFTSI